jgi:Protein of unknown function (DUF2752)
MATTATDAPGLASAPSTSRRGRLLAPLSVGAATAVLTLGLHFRDPHVQGSWGLCPTALLGFDCPACGSLRAVHHLTNLDIVAAASSNVLLVVFAPLAVLLWLRRVWAAWRGGDAMVPLRVPSSVWMAALVVVTIFTITRNLAFGAWLHS